MKLIDAIFDNRADMVEIRSGDYRDSNGPMNVNAFVRRYGGTDVIRAKAQRYILEVDEDGRKTLVCIL